MTDLSLGKLSRFSNALVVVLAAECDLFEVDEVMCDTIQTMDGQSVTVADVEGRQSTAAEYQVTNTGIGE